MWCRVDLVWTDVSEERIAFIFRVEKSTSEEPAWAGGCSQPEDGGDMFLQNVGSHDIRGTISQKMAFFMFTTVKI
jgi:hypothetical protein